MNLLPLGTVIKVNNYKACIIGYSSAEEASTTICGYFVVSYPLGFTNINKVLFIPHNLDFKVLAEGYKTAASEHVLDILGKGLELIENVSREDLTKFNQLYKEGTLSKKEASKE